MTHRILCVDPDTDTRAETVETLRAELTDLDPTFVTAESVAEVREALEADYVAATLTEYDLPDGTGFEVMNAVKDYHPDAGCILYTDADPDSLDTTTLSGPVTEYVGKGSMFGTQRLARLVRTTVETRAQASYPLPQNEDERLAALRTYNLDDAELIASLDRITDLAARHFGADTASVNVIDEHSQEFLACYGETTEWEAMDREDSICTFTILEDDVMVVEDVRADPRFESRAESLVDLGIRSYMGANLETPNGLRIGPLCVYDDDPRSFTAADRQYLADLADLAMDLIALHSERDEGAPPAGGGEA